VDTRTLDSKEELSIRPDGSKSTLESTDSRITSKAEGNEETTRLPGLPSLRTKSNLSKQL
jgi:hypothetical protein